MSELINFQYFHTNNYDSIRHLSSSFTCPLGCGTKGVGQSGTKHVVACSNDRVDCVFVFVRGVSVGGVSNTDQQQTKD